MNVTFSFLQKGAELKDLLKRFSYWVEYGFWAAFSSAKFKSFPSKIENVLIINHGALGDIFCSIRIVYNLSLTYPDKNFKLAVPQDYFLEVKNLEKNLNFKIISENSLPQKNVDLTLVFNFPYNLKSVDSHSYCIGNEYSSLTGSLRFNRSRLLNRKIAPLHKHKIDQEKAICRLAKLPLSKTLKAPQLTLNKFLLKQLKNKGEYVIIHPSGRNFDKILKEGAVPALAWSSERFAEVADFIIEKYGKSVIITGSSSEKEVGEEIKKLAKHKSKIFNFAGKSKVSDLISLVYYSNLVLSIDTSTVHIAELFDKPLIALYGPTFHEEIGPYGSPKNQITIAHPEVSIRDRRKGKARYFPGKGMDAISSKEVKEALNRLL